jgi:pilus assembly protein Flp/PilA
VEIAPRHKYLNERRRKRMKKLVKFLKDEEGMVAVEYALIATLVALAIIGGLTYLGTSINTKLSTIGSRVSGP